MVDNGCPKAVIVGGGHNGLVAGCELATAGFQVTLLESLSATGGAAVTDRFRCGCRVSGGASAFGMMPQFLRARLNLTAHGVKLIDPDPQHTVVLNDGRCMDLRCDQADTLSSIAAIDPSSCAAYESFTADVSNAAAAYAPFHLSPDPSEELLYQAMESRTPGLGDRFLRGSLKGALSYYFSNPALQAFASATLPLYPCRSDEAGSAFVLPLLAQGSGDQRGGYAVVRGGMGEVARALECEAKERGVKIRTHTRVKAIQVGDLECRVFADTGDIFTGHVVLSGLDPVTTGRLLGLSDPPPVQLRRLYRFGAVKVNAVLNVARYDGPVGCCPAGLPRSFFVLNSGLDLLDDAVACYQSSTLPARPYMEISLASILDTSLPCSREHQPISVYAMYFPDDLHEAPILELILSQLETLWPSLSLSVEDAVVLRPSDIASRWGMFFGNVDHGNVVPENRLQHRPATPAPNSRVVLCGAGRHPGGLVSGLPGYLAAHQVIREFSHA